MKRLRKMKKLNIIYITLLMLVFTGCEDFLEQEPVDLIGDALVIEDAASAEGTLLGMYSSMQTTNAWGARMNFDTGILSDEMVFEGTFPTLADFAVNNVTAENSSMRGYWAQAYITIFIANTVLERVSLVDPPLDAAFVAQLEAEAKFGRAFAHLDLVRLWGDVPLILTTEKAVAEIEPRSSASAVYAQIIQDLTEAEAVLAPSATLKDRATKGAAQALLARANLYSGNLASAGTWANTVIGSGNYMLEPNYANITQQNGAASQETIWQLFSSAADQNLLAWYTQPPSTGGRIDYSPSSKLVAMYGAGDARLGLIIPNAGETKSGQYYNKYADVGTGTDQPVILRLADMYLIRAEANSDVADINMVRARSGAAPLGAYSAQALLDERFMEFAFEGHRWNDLFRTGVIDAVMSVEKPVSWVSTDALLPIPQRELDQNPSLTQNPGY